MDLWVNVCLGSKWIDDDRAIHEKVEIQQEVMLTTLRRDIKQLKIEFLSVMGEIFDRVLELHEMHEKHRVKDLEIAPHISEEAAAKMMEAYLKWKLES